MCLIPKESAKIADKDIEVYKLLCKSLTGEYVSPFRRARYSINKLKTANIKYVRKYINCANINTEVIEEGIHAYIDYGRAMLASYSLNAFIFKAIVPKGAIYVLGEDEDIVSTQLKVIEICH